MSVAPNAGVVELDTFLPPSGGNDGQQGQVPKPLAGQETYVLTASGFSPAGSLPGLGTMATQNSDNVSITGGTVNVYTTNIASNTAVSATMSTPSLQLQPAGYINVDLNGTIVKVPYYAV